MGSFQPAVLWNYSKKVTLFVVFFIFMQVVFAVGYCQLGNGFMIDFISKHYLAKGAPKLILRKCL